jgi:hypothetical protein
VYASLKLGFHLVQLRLQPFAYRLPHHRSRYRCTGWSLLLLLTPSASRSEFLTRLNSRPARSPVNASTSPSRAAPHDSRPMWVATPLSYDFSIHYTSPVLTGAQGERTCRLFNSNQAFATATSFCCL